MTTSFFAIKPFTFFFATKQKSSRKAISFFSLQNWFFFFETSRSSLKHLYIFAFANFGSKWVFCCCKKNLFFQRLNKATKKEKETFYFPLMMANILLLEGEKKWLFHFIATFRFFFARVGRKTKNSKNGANFLFSKKVKL